MAQIAQERHLVHLTSAEVRLGRVFARPKVLATACIVTLAALGWIYLGWAIAQMIGAHGAGLHAPVRIFDVFMTEWWGAVGRYAVDVLCLPTFGSGGRASGMAAGGLRSIVDFALVFLMWGAMAFAMMLPSAGPMILTYAEIAETAAQKGERVVSPLVLATGYLSIWLGFALGATLLQVVLARASLIDERMAPASLLLSGGIFVAAGLYQFSALKHACLTQCQRPFPFFFSHWSTERRKIFRLGLSQGLYCLGCCWAMMLLMFAVGVMNVVWMALIGAIMAVEKLGTTMRLSRAAGFAVSAIGLMFIAAAAVDIWPVLSR
jgi:predicted metal-binding membrane protein